MNFIELEKDNYTIRIKLDKFSLGNGDLEYIIKTIKSYDWIWDNFSVGSDLYEYELYNKVTCVKIDYDNKIIVFA